MCVKRWLWVLWPSMRSKNPICINNGSQGPSGVYTLTIIAVGTHFHATTVVLLVLLPTDMENSRSLLQSLVSYTLRHPISTRKALFLWAHGNRQVWENQKRIQINIIHNFHVSICLPKLLSTDLAHVRFSFN